MSTFNDIKAKFQAYLIGEGNVTKSGTTYSPRLAKEVKELLFKNKKPGNKSQDLFGLRFGISGDADKTEKYISEVVLKGIDASSYRLSWLPPDRAKKGESQSGTFNTHKIMIIAPCRIGRYNALPGDQVFIIDNLKAKSSIQNKMLTPDGLGLSGGVYKKIWDLKDDVNRSLGVLLEKSIISQVHYDFMMLLFSYIEEEKTRFTSISDIPQGTPFKIVIKEDYSGGRISQPDIAKIAKDFGEILGGAYALKACGPGELGLTFPYESNLPLVDFFINGQAVSMKSGSGAAPSLSNVGQAIKSDYSKWYNLMSNDDQRLMLKVVLAFYENEAMKGLFIVADLINCPGWHYFKSLMGYDTIKGEDIDKKELDQKIRKMFTDSPDEAYNLFNEYFKALGKYPDNWGDKESQIEDARSRKYAFGLAMSPLAYHVKDYLNSNENIVKALSEVMQKFDIIQLYIDLNIGKTKSTLSFSIKPFATGNFMFNTTSSVNQPIRNKFSVKMIK